MEFSSEQIDSYRKRGFRPVAVGCIFNKNRILFVYKKDFDLWQLPQGGVDNGETIEETIKREMSEELGQDFANSLHGFRVFLRDMIEFPKETQGTRELFTDSGKEVYMRGKAYFFVISKTETERIEIDQSEFDRYKWLDYEEAMELTGKIYQKGKQRITKRILSRLKLLGIFN